MNARGPSNGPRQAPQEIISIIHIYLNIAVLWSPQRESENTARHNLGIN